MMCCTDVAASITSRKKSSRHAVSARIEAVNRIATAAPASRASK